MKIQDFISSKEVEINGSTFVISKIPATKAIELQPLIMQELLENGDLGLAMIKPELTMKLLAYAAKKMDDDAWRELDSKDIIDSCFDNAIDLIALRMEIINYSFGFLRDGSLLKLLGAKESASNQK